MGKPAPRIPLITGDEYDAFSRYKNVWSPGSRKREKRGYNKRARRLGKKEIWRLKYEKDIFM